MKYVWIVVPFSEPIPIAEVFSQKRYAERWIKTEMEDYRKTDYGNGMWAYFDVVDEPEYQNDWTYMLYKKEVIRK